MIFRLYHVILLVKTRLRGTIRQVNMSHVFSLVNDNVTPGDATDGVLYNGGRNYNTLLWSLYILAKCVVVAGFTATSHYTPVF